METGQNPKAIRPLRQYALRPRFDYNRSCLQGRDRGERRVSMIRKSLSLLLAMQVFHVASWALADVLVLKEGGRIHGRWVNRQSRPPSEYLVRTANGVEVKVSAARVVRAIVQSPATDRYDQIAPTTPDRVKDQWDLAEWCRSHGLAARRLEHLKRIIRLDTEHIKARRALGHVLLGSRWVSPQDWMAERGYQRYAGRWRSTQEIQQIKERRKRNREEAQWYITLQHWREALHDDDAVEAHGKIASIEDPLAIPALRSMLASERWRYVKVLYVDALAKIDNPAAHEALIKTSIEDYDEEICETCLDQLVRIRPAGAVATYMDVLSDSNARRINRAARALGRLGDKSAIAGLIDALVTTQVLTLRSPGPESSDAVTATFSKSGAGFSTGNRTAVVRRNIPNQEVLNALVKLSGGVSFSYDQQAWKYWLEAQPTEEVYGLRRESGRVE